MFAETDYWVKIEIFEILNWREGRKSINEPESEQQISICVWNKSTVCEIEIETVAKNAST